MGVVLMALCLSSGAFGMMKLHNKGSNEYCGLFIEEDGTFIIKKCTIEPQRWERRITERGDYFVTTTPIRHEEIGKINPLDCDTLELLLDTRKNFILAGPINAGANKGYLIEQIVIHRWPINWAEIIKERKYGSIQRWMNSPFICNLEKNSDDNHNTITYTPVVEIHNNARYVPYISVLVFLVYYYRNNPMKLMYHFFNASS